MSSGAVLKAIAGGLGALLLSVVVAVASSADGAFLVCGLLWSALLLLAFGGWGGWLLWLVSPAHKPDWGLRAVWGMCLLVAVGGLMNLLWLVSRPAIFALVAIGAAGELWWRHGATTSPREENRAEWRELWIDPLRLAVAAVVALLVVVQIAASLAGTIDTVFERPPFDLHDDAQAYLVFPEKMLQTGSMGAEPFEARRMLSLGGQSFLQTMVRAALPMRALHLLDMGLALALLVALVAGWRRQRDVDGRRVLFVILVVLAAPHMAMRGNTSAVLTGVVVLVALFRVLGEEILPERRHAAAGFLLAMLVAGGVSLKSTLIPPLTAIFVASAAALLVHRASRRRQVMFELAVAAGCTVLLVAPWMISIKLSNGTFLYPVLGRGTYGGIFTGDFAEVRGSFGVSTLQRVLALYRQLLGFLPAFVLAVFAADRPPRRPLLAILAAGVAGAVSLVWMGDPEINRAMARYAFPVVTACTLATMLACFDGPSKRANASLAAVVVGAFYLLGNPAGLQADGEQILRNLATAVAGGAHVPADDQTAIRTLQAALPEGAAVLATLRRPYLLDFGRNPVRIMSLPGMSSLPPGMPLFGSADELASYLVAKNLRYLAYGGVADTTDLLRLDEAMIRQRYPHSKMRWVMLRGHQRYHEIVDELRSSRKRLYDDGERVLLDVDAPVSSIIPEEESERMSGFVDGVWIDGRAAVDGLSVPSSGGFLMLRTWGWNPRRDDPAAIAPRVLMAGVELPMIAADSQSFTFQVAAGMAEGASVELVDNWLATDAIGTVATAPRVGLDIRSVEVAARRELLAQPIACRLQQVAGEVDPATVWVRRGFYDDNNWTDGHGVLDRLYWPIPDDHCEVVVKLSAAHPRAGDSSQIALRVAVNGLELGYLGSSERAYRFELPDSVEVVNRVDLRSTSFVPAESVAGSEDQRTLGVPVAVVTTAPAR